MNDQERIRAKLRQLDRLADLYLSPPDVAAVLDWSADTIREHLVPVTEWRDFPRDEQDAKIPFRKLGNRYLIPKFWVRRVLEQAIDPVPDETAQVG